MRKLALLLSLIAASPTLAATREDEQLWVNATVMGPVAGDLVYFAEVQPRFDQGVSHLGQLLLRPAIGLRLSPAVTVYQGYAHVALPIEGGRDRNEERSFQQVSWTISPTLSSRTRLEQRWLSDGNDTGWRVREMIRAETPLGSDRDGIAALGYAEVFVALNDTDWGARKGFDQLRTFAGLELPLKGKSTIEAGYLNQLVDRPRGDKAVNHVASISLFMRY
ncbi:DUF2490 domain-containing protein [Sphingomonas sp. ID0503]|uniref:DUF2490 domain-containing protein n=1 Tax=Sphingomonas sp. ID0503 TaxID=3399691 RepID=UPI003AFB7348